MAAKKSKTWNAEHKGQGLATAHEVGNGQRRRSPAADVAEDDSSVGLSEARQAAATPTGGEARSEARQRYQSKGGRLAKNLGKGWRRKVYGKNYVGGTVKGLNQQIKERRNRAKTLTEKTRELESQLASGGNKSAIESRLNKLEENKQTVNANLTNSKDSRQHYLNMRDKAIAKLENMTPSEKKLLRDRAARKKLAKHKEPEAAPTTTGGTEAK